MGGIVDTITGKSGKRAAQASERAAGVTAEAQREQLAYLKETEALPLSIRNQFMPQLADIYSGGQGQQNLINQAKDSPLYQQQIAGIEGSIPFAEEAALRNRSATGGLRSGAAIEDMAQLAQDREDMKNQALTQSYNQQLQGIQGLAGVNLNTNAIGQAIAAPGTTIGQGIVAGAQARQQGDQALTNAAIGLGGAALMAPIGTFSDIRLKDNIEYICIENGHNIYKWDWRPEAKELGLTGSAEGVMAHQVYETNPEAVSTTNGYIMVNYEMLGLNKAAA